MAAVENEAGSLCIRCGEGEATRFARGEEALGILYLAPASIASDDDAIAALCESCWPRWLMFLARQGYDLHTHGHKSDCRTSCLARGSGRYAQIVSLWTLYEDNRNGFESQKLMDGLPGVNGSTPLAGARLAHWSGLLGRLSQGFYEYAPSLEQFLEQLAGASEMKRLHYPPWAYDHFALTFEAFESAHSAARGVISRPTASDSSIGLHCVAVDELSSDGTQISFWNSWGRSWGIKGRGVIELAYLESYFQEAMVRRNARYGPTRHKKHLDRLVKGTRQHRSLMAVKNPVLRWRERQGGRSWDTCLYESMSPSDGVPVQCLELRNGYSLKLGWAFVYHHHVDDSRWSEIKEIFVWPLFRRQGIGRYLEAWACRLASEAGSTQIQLVMNRPDANVGPVRAASRGFGRERGYEWRWPQTPNPPISGRGFKAL